MESQAQYKMLLSRTASLPVLNERGGYKWSRPVTEQVPRRLFYRTTPRVPVEASNRARSVCSRMGTAGGASRRVSLTVSAAGQGSKPAHKPYSNTVRVSVSTEPSGRPRCGTSARGVRQRPCAPRLPLPGRYRRAALFSRHKAAPLSLIPRPGASVCSLSGS